MLEGHEELVRCIRFDNKRIVSGAYDGCAHFFGIIDRSHRHTCSKIKVWDLQAALDPRSSPGTICLRTLVVSNDMLVNLFVRCYALIVLCAQEHTGRVFRLQFDEFQIVSSSHDDTILIWDFLNYKNPPQHDIPLVFRYARMKIAVIY